MNPVLATVLRKLTPLVGILAFLVVWEVAVAPPSVILDTFVGEFPKLAYHGWVTLCEMLLGYALALVVGVPERFNDYAGRIREIFKSKGVLAMVLRPRRERRIP